MREGGTHATPVRSDSDQAGMPGRAGLSPFVPLGVPHVPSGPVPGRVRTQYAVLMSSAPVTGRQCILLCGRRGARSPEPGTPGSHRVLTQDSGQDQLASILRRLHHAHMHACECASGTLGASAPARYAPPAARLSRHLMPRQAPAGEIDGETDPPPCRVVCHAAPGRFRWKAQPVACSAPACRAGLGDRTASRGLRVRHAVSRGDPEIAGSALPL